MIEEDFEVEEGMDPLPADILPLDEEEPYDAGDPADDEAGAGDEIDDASEY